MSIVTLACLLAAATGPTSQDRATTDGPPDAVKAFEASRSKYLTGEVRFSVTWHDGVNKERGEQFYTARFAGDDYLLDHTGNKDGIQGYMHDTGEPVSYVDHELMHDGNQWKSQNAGVGVELQMMQTDVIDVRSIGVAGRLPQAANFSRLVLPAGTQIDYEVHEAEDGMVVVVRRVKGQTRRVEWTLDPRKDWNLVRSVSYQGDKLVNEERLTLAKFEGDWFPKHWQRFDAKFNGGKTPIEEITISHAAFNKPNQPVRFTPADIGVDVGTPLTIYRTSMDRARRQSTAMTWDGEKPIPNDEFRKRLDSGDLKLGPKVVAIIDEILIEGQKAEFVLDLWTNYTVAFIKRFKLDEEQAQKAMLILDDCKQQAQKYFTAKADDLTKAREEGARILKGENMDSETRDRELRKAKARMDELQEPINRIFHLKLVPRLNRLPTTAQMKAEKETRESAELPKP